ncbi:hypothetical protein SP5_066_00020 [Sphingomonas parapaucimobilis NBRC 15100]|uniref:Uncharacterized protein n=1 Tax=Sphingomonas parapaucimobilis NBRC 15100 TaxID=1219049 RepID=A0A0A1W8Q4_9SPHN|nr:hypothetical protein SP5_066_00020 [Sphingomonas parapaucimobilis NBRC 15100]
MNPSTSQQPGTTVAEHRIPAAVDVPVRPAVIVDRLAPAFAGLGGEQLPVADLPARTAGSRGWRSCRSGSRFARQVRTVEHLNDDEAQRRHGQIANTSVYSYAVVLLYRDEVV